MLNGRHKASHQLFESEKMHKKSLILICGLILLVVYPNITTAVSFFDFNITMTDDFGRDIETLSQVQIATVVHINVSYSGSNPNTYIQLNITQSTTPEGSGTSQVIIPYQSIANKTGFSENFTLTQLGYYRFTLYTQTNETSQNQLPISMIQSVQPTPEYPSEILVTIAILAASSALIFAMVRKKDDFSAKDSA
jgi:hypothetical protein